MELTYYDHIVTQYSYRVEPSLALMGVDTLLGMDSAHVAEAIG